MITLKVLMSLMEKQKDYKSDIFKIAGFALFTPIGRVFIEPVVVFHEFGFNGFLIYMIVCLCLLLLGLTFMYVGHVTLEK